MADKDNLAVKSEFTMLSKLVNGCWNESGKVDIRLRRNGFAVEEGLDNLVTEPPVALRLLCLMTIIIIITTMMRMYAIMHRMRRGEKTRGCQKIVLLSRRRLFLWMRSMSGCIPSPGA